MVTVDMVHVLSKGEKESLKMCIGKRIDHIISPGAILHAGLRGYEFLGTLSLLISGLDGFILISTQFSETNFGDNFHKVRISHAKYPEGIDVHQSGALQFPFTSLYLNDFVIDKIEVYGYSYGIVSANADPDPVWKILRRYSGKSVKEQIETENILVFCSGEKTIVLSPSGPVEGFDISYDERPEETSIKLKYVIQ